MTSNFGALKKGSKRPQKKQNFPAWRVRRACTYSVDISVDISYLCVDQNAEASCLFAIWLEMVFCPSPTSSAPTTAASWPDLRVYGRLRQGCQPPPVGGAEQRRQSVMCGREYAMGNGGWGMEMRQD